MCPRSILKRQVEAAADAGYDFLVGVECEVYMVRDDRRSPESGTSTPLARSGSLKPTPAYDIEVSLDALGLLDDMVATLNEAGFDVFSFDAEGGDGQYEFDFQHRSALEMADKVTFFRLAAKQIAKQHGLVATFMPKPYTEAWGSGAHYNMSLAELDERREPVPRPRRRARARLEQDGVRLRRRHPAARRGAVGDLRTHRQLLQAAHRAARRRHQLVGAGVGDLRRQQPLVPAAPAAQPARVSRTAASTPPRTRISTAAFLLAAGLEGVREQLDPGDPVEDLTYDWSPQRDRERAPARARCWRRSTRSRRIHSSRACFRSNSSPSTSAMKRAEWDEFHGQVTEWERTKYFDMF